MARNYKSIAEPKTLAADVLLAATQITLNNVTGLPSPPYVLVLNPDTASEEVILVDTDQSGVTSPTLKVTRAIETGATAKTHTNGDTVKHMIVGSDLQLAHDHIDLTAAHGATGAIVGTTNTQTLTSKTLTLPKINENVTLTATATELNVLDGITASTAELNIMDGVLASTAELNYVDGVTSSIQTQIDTKAPSADPTFTGTVVLPSTTSIGTVSATEIGYVDGVTSAIQTQLNTLTSNLSAAVPAGVITQFGGASAPSGWVLCDGTAYSRTVTYNNLFTAVGEAYGAGDGSTTFNVPNLKGRVPVGQDTTANTTYTVSSRRIASNVAILTTSVDHDLVVGDSITVASLDATFNGTYTVTGTTTTTVSYAKTNANISATASSGTVVATNLPFDVLGETGGASKHRLLQGEVGVHSHSGQIVFDTPPTSSGTGGIIATGTGDSQPNTGDNAGGGVHNNLQPYIVVNYIIKY